ncbi:unnamed protein product, partial [Rangifer tarandus platyrhynchus]
VEGVYVSGQRRKLIMQNSSSLSKLIKLAKSQVRENPSNEYSGLISFRMDWLDLLAVQGTLKSLLQHHSPKHQFF